LRFAGGLHWRRTAGAADIVELVRAARATGLYVSLITSGLPLDEAKLDSLVAAGLDHFQLSFQGAREETAVEISGTRTHAQKLRVLEWLKSRRLAVTLNFVLHRRNLDEMDEMIAIAGSSSATRIEFANVQYYGWAFANRERLLPTRTQLNEFVEKVKPRRNACEENPGGICCAGLLREVSKTLHGRLGTQGHADYAKR